MAAIAAQILPAAYYSRNPSLDIQGCTGNRTWPVFPMHSCVTRFLYSLDFSVLPNSSFCVQSWWRSSFPYPFFLASRKALMDYVFASLHSYNVEGFLFPSPGEGVMFVSRPSAFALIRQDISSRPLEEMHLRVIPPLNSLFLPRYLFSSSSSPCLSSRCFCHSALIVRLQRI